MLRAVIIVSALIGAPLMAAAQSADDTVSSLLACRSEASDEARLACFDREVDALAIAPPHTDILSPTLNVSTTEGTAPEEFGGEQLPSARPDPDEIVRELQVRIASTERSTLGKLIFTLENGQVWRQLDADSAAPRIPSSSGGYGAIIRRGSFGSYRLLIEDRRPAVRVRRVQ